VSDLIGREFPEVAALVRRIPNPPIARAPLLWSVLAGFGAGYFVWAAILIVFALLFGAFGIPSGAPLPRPFELAAVTRTGVALAVAWTAGGRNAVTVYATVRVLELVLGLPAQFRFCGAIIGPAPTACSFFSYLLSLWPLVLGVALAYWLAPRLRSSTDNANPTMEAAGALSATQTVAGTIVAVLFVGSASIGSGILAIGGVVAAGLACGVVLLRRVTPERQWLTLGFVALAAIGPWAVTSLPPFVQQIGVGGGLAISGLSLVAFVAPQVSLWGLARISAERAWMFVVGGVFALVLGAVLWYVVFTS